MEVKTTHIVFHSPVTRGYPACVIFGVPAPSPSPASSSKLKAINTPFSFRHSPHGRVSILSIKSTRTRAGVSFERSPRVPLIVKGPPNSIQLSRLVESDPI